MQDGTIFIKNFEYVINTDGNGLWSDVGKPVQVIGIECTVKNFDDDDHIWGELRVYFDTDTWNVRKDGLIYTDPVFLDELRGYLELNGIDDTDLDYSEAGMQGENYVSFDVGETFINSWALEEWLKTDLVGK